MPHSHEDEHDHSESLPKEVSVRELIRLGIAGGMVPCPTATVVLLTAIALQKIAFGIALVVAFSVGLAAVLMAIGVAMVLAGSLLERFSGKGRLMRLLPLGSAVLVTILGILVTVNGLRDLLGLTAPNLN